MVQIDVPVAFAIGSIFADAAHRQLQTGRPEYYYHAFHINNIFQIFFFSWIPVYFLLNYFGWETTHMWWHEDSVTAYPYYVPIFMIVFFLAGNLGFQLGYWLVKKGLIWANRVVYILIFVYATAWIFGQTGSTFRLGTYNEWAAGAAPWFYEDRTFLSMLIFTLIVWWIALVSFIIRLRREGKHLDT
jgi:uncharacterized membrane protein